MSKRKQVTMLVTVSVNAWMTAAQARREVRSLIKDQCGHMGHGGPDGWDEVEVKPIKIKPAKETK